MAVPFYLPEGGADDVASSSSGASGNSSPHNHPHAHVHPHPPLSASSSSSGVSSASSSSSGVSSSASSSSDGTSSVASQSPNTTTSSATQTPMQSPLPTDQVLYALCEWVRIYQSQQSAPQVFQYPPPQSPSCNYTGGDVFFPHGHPNPNPNLHPRTPRSSVSFSSGEEYSFFRQQQQPQPHPPYPAPSTPQPMPPQSAPPMHCSHSYPQQSPHLMPHHGGPFGMGGPGPYYAAYTPPPTPNTASAGTSSSSSFSSAAFGWHGPLHTAPSSTSTPLSAPLAPKMRLQRSQSDAARRKRLTSTGEDEREYQSDHEASWDWEFDDRYDNFTAGRERLQEFNGRIPPRKKKNSHPISNPISSCNSQPPSSASQSASGATNSGSSTQQRQVERERQKPQKKKPQSFTWPTVVTVFVLAMGCGFFAAR
ncbi:cell death protein hid [Drosophila ficusphila]|uniref:cell death protein hid n=1 Tax=Drosophila ficusphila TaxID=30025 RepID=UPI0007E7EAD2|nr:cell death protein hid [Drosophila ficusphila]